MEKLKVIIADDHPIVLLGVRELVEGVQDRRLDHALFDAADFCQQL